MPLIAVVCELLSSRTIIQHFKSKKPWSRSQSGRLGSKRTKVHSQLYPFDSSLFELQVVGKTETLQIFKCFRSAHLRMKLRGRGAQHRGYHSRFAPSSSGFESWHFQKNSEKKLSMMPRLIDGTAAQSSGRQRLKYVDRTHLVLASGKLQKN